MTCGTFPAFLCFPASFEIRNANNSSTYRYYNTRFVHTFRYYTLLDHMHAQLRSVRLYIAQQRSVAPCGAVRSRAMRCRALRCGAVSLRCVLSFENRAVSTGYNACCVRSTTFPLFSSTCHTVLIFHGPLFFPSRKLPPYCRSDTGNKRTQHS